ncbi:MAG: ABC transporter ATP-binding protein, partial [Candidatus Rokubacteria bacterium]|nr:ABC transporter ATP-binding protein [Candidatus Rokubacteria bacterium]
MTEKIRVRVTQRFGDLLVLDGIDFSVRENEFLCILG